MREKTKSGSPEKTGLIYPTGLRASKALGNLGRETSGTEGLNLTFMAHPLPGQETRNDSQEGEERKARFCILVLRLCDVLKSNKLVRSTADQEWQTLRRMSAA